MAVTKSGRIIAEPTLIFVFTIKIILDNFKNVYNILGGIFTPHYPSLLASHWHPLFPTSHYPNSKLLLILDV